MNNVYPHGARPPPVLLPVCHVTARPSPRRGPSHRPTTNPNAAKFAQKIGGSERCPRCSQAVYAAEKVIGAGKVRRLLGQGGCGDAGRPSPFLKHGFRSSASATLALLSQPEPWAASPSLRFKAHREGETFVPVLLVPCGFWSPGG